MAKVSSEPVKKPPTVFKKVLKYFQDQAVEQSHSTAIYLTPPGQEPQQKIRHRQNESPKEQRQMTRNKSRTFSDATTAVDPRGQSRGGVDASTNRTSSAMPSRAATTLGQGIKKIQYATENLLQSYELYIPEKNIQESRADEYWVLFVHGGYFKDPQVDAASFRPALEILTSSSPTIREESEAGSTNSASSVDLFSVQRHIAGYASINYRLSPHPGYPQNPETTPNYELRNAKFPDQVEDVQAAIRHLQSRHGFGSKYILAGHSVGATLAFLAALRAKAEGVPAPACIVGLNGIYDFPGIHRTNPDYEVMTRNAIDPRQYEEASPALHATQEFAKISEAGTTHFLLSHSRNDGLVVWDQIEEMQRVLEQAKATGEFDMQVMETKGQHDEIWRQGNELVRVIKKSIAMVVEL